MTKEGKLKYKEYSRRKGLKEDKNKMCKMFIENTKIKGNRQEGIV